MWICLKMRKLESRSRGVKLTKPLRRPRKYMLTTWWDLERMNYPLSRHPKFHYKTEFQSHSPEFDYLKSLEIEEKINIIRWCQIANSALFLFSNDKTIKFWKG